MAITYTTSFSESSWNFSENNNIIEFSSDSVKTPVYCDIDITGLNTIRIYPIPNRTFYFNFKEYLSTLFNSYDDDLDPSTINIADIDTFIFDWSRTYFNDDIDIVINFDDETTDSDTITPFVILGHEQLKPYKYGETVTGLSQFILSPLKQSTANRFYLKYWEGYPFDIGLTSNIPTPDTTQTITNNTNALTSPDISLPYDVNRIFISDGDSSVTLEDYLPLTLGYNELQLQEDNNGSMFIDLWKHDADCGVYIKWLNQYGGYNYWLFNEQHENNLGHRSKGIINNNFSNIYDSVSPFKSLGRTVEESIVVRAEHLNSDDINILKGIVQSHKIYLFIGERFTQNTFNDWIEIELSNGNMLLRDFKGNTPDVTLTFKLPDHYTI